MFRDYDQWKCHEPDYGHHRPRWDGTSRAEIDDEPEQEGEERMENEQPQQKRFFVVDDGCDYWLVARDLDHAKQILRDCGVELTGEDGWSHPIDDPALASLEWVEVSAERAAKINCHRDDSGRGPSVPLSECELGEWFASEW